MFSDRPHIRVVLLWLYRAIFSSYQFPYWFFFQCYWWFMIGFKYVRKAKLVFLILAIWGMSEGSSFILYGKLSIFNSFASLLCFFVFFAIFSATWIHFIRIQVFQRVFSCLHMLGIARCFVYFLNETKVKQRYLYGFILSMFDPMLYFLVSRSRKSLFFSFRVLLMYTLYYILTEEIPFFSFNPLPYGPIAVIVSTPFALIELCFTLY